MNGIFVNMPNFISHNKKVATAAGIVFFDDETGLQRCLNSLEDIRITNITVLDQFM
jgi:hypothetical protein